ncbi:hypothetical protein MKK75_14865 [Methylobacterium sp. J-030]|uniref:hypothetical protein n=1 Tax=Methylobacterium sp. J-030 TaxID=2836627 RepID=UPI001FBA4372|nr:hypothetical protein [Methylobacterium sp. J-030]MCJ2070061.1 hypothetical protein [Methylobacterium sp. J-030]
MGDVLTFIPRPKPAAIVPPAPLTGPALRASLEEAAQIALDAADRIIAVLDQLDGDPDMEDGADAEPSLAAPENVAGSQMTWLRGGDQDREEEVSEPALQVVVVEPQPADENLPEAVVLPWRGRGNVIAAAGVMILDMLERA